MPFLNKGHIHRPCVCKEEGDRRGYTYRDMHIVEHGIKIDEFNKLNGVSIK